MFLCRTNGLQTNKLLAILARVHSLYRERITLLPGKIRLTQDNSRQRCKTGVNKTEGNEKPGKQEKKVNSYCNS